MVHASWRVDIDDRMKQKSKHFVFVGFDEKNLYTTEIRQVCTQQSQKLHIFDDVN